MISPHKNAILKELAEDYLSLGMIDKFCDINFEIKNYEKALIFAPGAGIS